MGKLPPSNPIPLGENVLRHINVTAKENHGNLALLRDYGRFTWPHALTAKGMVSPEDQMNIGLKAQTAVQEALRGSVPRETVADLKTALSAVGDKLIRKVNDIPGRDYLEAKRFLNNFDAACIALDNGEAVGYFNFQQWIGGGKTIQEVVDYLAREGLLFAPAIHEGESAYRAAHSALAAYDLDVSPPASTLASTERP
jgi:hypothetical protein